MKPIHKRKAGEAPEGRLPIYDFEGNMRGHVTHAATQSTVSRFIGRHGSTLGTKNGKKAWIGPPPPPPKPMPKPALAAQPKPAQSANSKLEISIKGAMGSAKPKAKGASK